MKIKQPTYTTLIEEFLRSTENMHTYKQILDHLQSQIPIAYMNHVSAACIHLKRHGVLDFIVETDGNVWWYALPKEYDKRSRVLVERAEESRPRKRRRKITIIIHMNDDLEGCQDRTMGGEQA